MRTHARAVIVGGGCVGVSLAYHLAKLGWSDTILLEKSELTAGSTWHAAGLLPLFNMSYSVGQIHKYSIELYKTLEAETGQDVGFHVTGNLRLAATRDRMDEYRKYCGTANTIGVPFEMVGPGEIRKLWPLAETHGLIGALFHPHDGHVAPVDLTNALAAGARAGGVEIVRHTRVVDIRPEPDGAWRVVTDKGEIVAEHIATATGSWCRQTLALVGLDVPVIPVEHQYIVTDTHPALAERHAQGLREMPVLRESDASYYLREERDGFILGVYERDAPACFVDGVPDDFGQELFPGDVGRLEPHIEAAIGRVPAFGEAGVRDVVNGAIPYTPDGNPLIGPAYGLRNFWLAEGFSFGVTAAGGAGRFLAEWMDSGEPPIDMLAVDPRRFGAYANKSYAVEKNEEAYRNVFTVHYPDEERPAARPAKTSPVHARHQAAGAVFGQRYGWERPNWFAPPGRTGGDVWSFRRTNWFGPVGGEVRLVRESVGVIDITSFSKFGVSGPGAEGFLETLVANRLPGREGAVRLGHALTSTGGVRSEFSIMRDGPEDFHLVSSGAAERYDHDHLAKMMPGDGSVRLENLTERHGVLVLAGPRARDVLGQLTGADLSNAAFPWLTGRHIRVGVVPVRALRVNFVGELGWELHHPIEYQVGLYDALMRAGREYGIGGVGMRAMESLRVEKSYRMWGLDLTTEYSALEAGLDRFVALDKPAFRGREALLRQRDEGVPQAFVTLEVDAADADAWGNEPVLLDGETVGRVTSGAYGHSVGKSLALAYVRAGIAAAGTELAVDILGERRPARIIPASPHDPANIRLRA